MNYEECVNLVKDSKFIDESPSFYKVYHHAEIDITIKIKDTRAIVYFNRISDLDDLPCRFKDHELFIKELK